MPTEAQYEKLDTHLFEVVMHGDFMTSLTPVLWIHTFHLMFDAAIDCGMDFEEVDPEAWATRTLKAWCSFPHTPNVSFTMADWDAL